MRTARAFWFIGCIFALAGVAAGAFGAHALRDRLPQSLLAIFETGVRYQMYHAFALMATGALARLRPGKGVVAAGWLFTAGVVVFSGSLYLLATTGVLWLGAITPLGGAAFLAGWAMLALAGSRALAQEPTRWQ